MHPEVVKALIDLADARVLKGVTGLLLDEDAPRSVRRAASYILHKATGEPVDVDPDVPIARQRQAARRLRAQFDGGR